MTSNVPSPLISPAVSTSTHRYYRPELDLLRLLAFSCVFLTHGPRLLDHSGSQHWISVIENKVAASGVYGLSLFFFLSSYLITELLLREREKTGTVHLRWFYVRRALRIWPLYYVAVLLANATFLLLPGTGLTGRQLAALLLLIGYLVGGHMASPFAVLWSISVEELFYAIWPFVSKNGAKRLRVASLLFVGLALLICAVQAEVWYNPFAHFLFFASGALCALWMRSATFQLQTRKRWLLAFTGLGCWLTAPHLYVFLSVRQANPAAFLLADAGCWLLFLAFFNAPVGEGRVVAAMLYLGRISYGLYVFHLLCLMVVERFYAGSRLTGLQFVVTYAFALTATILIAAASHEWLEKPFIRVKDRFAPIQTRL